MKSRKGLEVGRWFGPGRWTSEQKGEAERWDWARWTWLILTSCGLLGVRDYKNCILRLEGQLLPPQKARRCKEGKEPALGVLVIQAAVQKYHRLGAYKQQKCVSHSSGG